MKKSVLFLLLVAFTISCEASNLEFSQVILIDLSAPFSQTVPNGKIWEIKSCTPEGYGNTWYVTINGKHVALAEKNTGTSIVLGYNVLPFWVPAGSVLSQVGTETGFMSIIEYNVVP